MNLVSLKMSCSCISTQVTDEICKNNLKKMIHNDGINFNHVCFIIQATNAIISGSTILQILNNENKGYNLSDVDIYVEEKNQALLNALLFPYFDYSKIPLKNSKGETYYFKVQYPTGGFFKNTNPSNEYPEILPKIVGLYNYTARKKVTVCNFEAMGYIRPYQIIILENGVNPKDYVKNFDLTFCQNWFDGENFFSYHPDCVKSRSGYHTRKVDEKRKYRIEKYEHRGFKVLNE